MADLTGLISISRKAGFVIIGQENLVEYDKKLYLLLMDKSAGRSLTREMNFLSQKRKVPLMEIENLSDIMKIENCKVIGIKNKNLSEAIAKIVKGE